MSGRLRARLVSTAIFLPLVVALVWLGAWTWAALLAAVAVLGGWELALLLERMGWRAPRFLPVLAPAVFAAALALGPRPILNALTALFWLAAVLWLFVPRVPAARKLGSGVWLVHAAGAVLLGLLLACLGRLVEGPWPGGPAAGSGTGPAFFSLLVVWSCDTGAYVIGSLAGRRRMWPEVSPAKTWEGALGGTAAAVGAAVLLARPPFVSGLAPREAFLIGLAASVAAQLGDLFESRLKRKAGVKDSGGIMPGHGGMLDRIDSLLFAAPVFAYALNLLLG